MAPSFFETFEAPPKQPQPETQSKDKLQFLKVGASPVICIHGDDLIKVVADDPSIPEGKVDSGQARVEHWVPFNYNPITGEMI